MTRFLCVLLLVGLVATPRSEPQSPEVSPDQGVARTAAALSGASLMWSDRSGLAFVDDVSPQSQPTSDAPSPVRGFATWFDAKNPQTAAAGPSLRKALGRHWRGSTVRVTSRGRAVIVRLTDWCLCSRGNRVIDLDDAAFSRLAPLGTGVIPVTVELVSGRAVPLAPATDVQ